MVKRKILKSHVYLYLDWLASGNLDENPPNIHPFIGMWCHAMGYVKIVADPASCSLELTDTGMEERRNLSAMFSKGVTH